MTDTNTTIADNNEEVALVKTEKNTLTVNRTEATFTKAPTLLDVDFDSLVASAEDIETLREQGLVEEDYEFYTGEGTGAGGFTKYDTSRLDHRVSKFKDDSAITWTREVPKHIKDTGVTAYPTEIALKHRVVGVRGLFIQGQFGFGVSSMLETEVKKDGVVTTKKVFPCSTNKARNLDNNTEVDSNRPLPQPYSSQLHKSAKEPNATNPRFPWQHKELLARKFDFNEQEYSKSLKSCQDCVNAGEWFITSYKDENDATKYKWGGDLNNVIQGGKCSLNGNLLFFVTQIGIDVLDSPHYDEDSVTHAREVKWVLPEDLNMKDRDKGKQTGPFILRVEGLGRSVMQKIGDGPWDLNVKLPSSYQPTEEKSYYLPDDNVLSVYQFIQFLYDKDHTERRAITNKGTTIFPVFAEMYFAPLVEVQATKGVTPVIRVLEVGIDKEVEGVKMIDYLKAAAAVYSKEIAEANGEVTDIKVPSFPVVTPGVLPSYNTGNPTLTKKAFTPAIKTLPDTESVASKAFKSNLSKTAAPAQPVPKAYSKPSKEDMLIEDEDDSDEDT